MLNAKNFPNSFWAEEVNRVFYIHNRGPTQVVRDITPQANFIGVKPTIDHMRVFRCTPYMHVPKDHKKKLNAKSIKCIFLGYAIKHKA